MRPAPAGATWFLKLFCSSSEYESVTGDLLEQYQRGRGRFWYWRQVLFIVFLGLYGKVVRRPLVPTNRGPMGAGLAVILLVGVVSAFAALSVIWPILLVAVVGGVIAGILRFAHDNQDADSYRTTRDLRVAQTETAPLRIPNKEESAYALPRIHAGEEKKIPMSLHRGINSTSIAGEGLDGLPGLIIAIAFVFMFFSIFLPRKSDWFGALFFIVEVGAAALYILSARRNRKDSERLSKVLHQINQNEVR